MVEPQVIREVFDLTDPDRNAIFGMSLDEGAIGSLDDSIADYLTDWAGTPEAAVTLRDLLEMRSGLSTAGESTIYWSGDALTSALFGLTGDAAAAEVCFDVVAAEALGLLEGTADQDLERFTGEVLVHGLAVDGDLAGAELETDSGDGALALTGGLDDAGGH